VSTTRAPGYVGSAIEQKNGRVEAHALLWSAKANSVIAVTRLVPIPPVPAAGDDGLAPQPIASTVSVVIVIVIGVAADKDVVGEEAAVMEVVVVIMPVPRLPISVAVTIPSAQIAIVGKATIAAAKLPSCHSRTGESRATAPCTTASHHTPTAHMAAEGCTAASAAESGMASAESTSAHVAATTTSSPAAMSDEDDGAVMDGTCSVL
jgi:hypothetical protein